jgi:hypothetical protein
MNGLIGFLVVVALAVATYFLGRSLFAHLRKVPASFEPPPGAAVTPDESRRSR